MTRMVRASYTSRPVNSTFRNIDAVTRRAGVAAAVLAAWSVLGYSARAAAADAEGVRFFEAHVRPLFSANCYECHAGDEPKGGLRLDSRSAAMTGGESGAVIDPGKPESSLLITAVRYLDSSLEMPPKKKLSKKQVALLTQWIQMGAPWPEEANAQVVADKRERFEITEKDRNYWAFRPIQSPPAPAATDGQSVANPIDAFVNEQLREKGLRPNGRASRRVLIRRLYYDLVGLPPTIEEIEAFERDPSPRAYENLIDRLLASPRHGERWGRHWLDVVRYAQSNGYERDDEKPLAWKYRDYVIDAFNQDKPYDRFVLEQLAGDELPDGGGEALIATGFYRLGVWDDEPDDKRAAYYDELDDIMRATGETFLGLTVGCARCHDHMFDPMSQRDYYELLSVFHNVQGFARPEMALDSVTYSPIAGEEQLRAFQKSVAERLKPVQKELAALRALKEKTDEQRGKLKELEDREREIRKDRGPFEYALSIRERGTEPKETRVLIRGNAGRPGDRVEARIPDIFGGQAVPLARREGVLASSGQRLGFARWVASPDNPLTARVMVNRIWQHHFGAGLVNTPNDFGRAGAGVSHPELLDWLAAKFIEGGWSIKKLHKLILLSETFQRASSYDETKAALDPGNRLLWRQNLRRLEAEAIRDSMLSATGELNETMGGRGVFANLNGEVIAGGSRPGRGWGYSNDLERNRRSAYLFVKRTMGVPFMEAFDYANTEGSIGRRPVTTVAPQALTLLNSEFVAERARAMARRSAAATDPESAVVELYRRLLARNPGAGEIETGVRFIMAQTPRLAAVSHQLVFQPDVPAALSQEFWNQLPAARFLRAPAGWSLYKGSWGDGYEGIINVRPDRGPFALLTKMRFRDGRISGRLRLDATTTHSGFILRADAAGEQFFGADLLIDSRAGRVSLRRLKGERVEKEVRTDIAIPADEWINFEVTLDGNTITAQFGNEETVGIQADEPFLTAGNGSFGVRTWGGATTLENLTIEANGSVVRPHELDFGRTPHLAAQQDRGSGAPGWKAWGGDWLVAPDGEFQIGAGKGHKILWEEFGAICAGTVSMDLRLAPGGPDIAGFILRVSEPAIGADNWIGYEVSLNTANKTVFIGTHNHNWKLQASAPAKIERNRWHHLEVRLEGQRMRVFVDGGGKPLLDFEQPIVLQPGLIGIRNYGPAVQFKNITARVGDKVATYKPHFPERRDAPWSVARRDLKRQAFERAIADFASALFNLNEFVYVD